MRGLIAEKVAEGIRITDEEAVYLYQEAELADLRAWATTARNRFHRPNQATYLIMRIINYTNVCVAKCDYCSFYRLPKSPDGYVLPRDQIYAKIDEILELGGDFVGFNGGFNPKLKLDWYQETFRQIRERYGDTVEFYALTVAEMMYVAKLCRISYAEVCYALKDAGVRWITGGGAEILTNAFRERHSPQKYTADDYMLAQETIMRCGLNSTGTMVIGFDESIDERVEHLRRVREMQDRLRADGLLGLFSFLSWTYKPYHNELGGQEVDGESYLRHLAVARLYLDNITHMRTSVLTQNSNALHGLHYGANDFDIPLEDEVTQMAGAVINRNIKEIIAQAENEGITPVFRPMAQAPALRNV
ncbi:radical SAM protein [Acanthopleuribacter pedis]|uniref:Radical SAM protein n=1 Tax=Acanthopleuribacter pedis TaxID=442870 RepID=A0A8J7QN85_9BACT|nr:radical SAM protein [Acanthopleuribacter pedis]MBO1321115.1 radical SAM protein [Acanthopleuribacter pedis]